MARAEIAFEIFVGQMPQSGVSRTNSQLPSFVFLLIMILTYVVV